jgi:hypothetical protein
MIKRIIITVLVMTGLFIVLINAHAQTLGNIVSINKVCTGTGIGFQSPTGPIGINNLDCYFECRHFKIRDGLYVLVKTEQCNPKDYEIDPDDFDQEKFKM